MKKSVVLVIGLIYIVSVVLVGFLGMKMRVYEEQIYVTDIECEATGLVSKKPGEDYQYCYVITFQKGASVEIKSRVIPDNATYDDVEYFWDTDKSTITINTDTKNTAIVTFLYPDGIMLNVRSTDGKNVEKGIYILAIEI